MPGERARPVLGHTRQHPGVGALAPPAERVERRMRDEHQVRRVALQDVHRRDERAGREAVLGLDEPDVIALDEVQGEIARPARPDALVEVVDSHAPVAPGQLVEQPGRVVGRRVVDRPRARRRRPVSRDSTHCCRNACSRCTTRTKLNRGIASPRYPMAPRRNEPGYVVLGTGDAPTSHHAARLPARGHPAADRGRRRHARPVPAPQERAAVLPLDRQGHVHRRRRHGLRRHRRRRLPHALPRAHHGHERDGADHVHEPRLRAPRRVPRGRGHRAARAAAEGEQVQGAPAGAGPREPLPDAGCGAPSR